MPLAAQMSSLHHEHEASLGLDRAPNLLRIQVIFDDVPEETRERLAHRYRTGLELGIGTSDRTMVEAYNFLLKLGSHDSTILRAAFGDPERVLFTEIWGEDLFICSLLEYAKDVRCEFTLGHTKRKWFDEELCAYGMKSTVAVRFPSPFLKNGPTQVEVTEMDGAAVSERRVVGSFEESFRRELEHFHDCIVEGREPLANVRDAKKDIEFLRDIVVCGMTRAMR